MKKKIPVAVFGLLLFSNFLMAQQEEPVVLNIVYQFSHINDLNKPDQPIREEMMLRLGKNESKYSNWTIEYQAKMAKSRTSMPGGPKKIYMGYPAAVVKSGGVSDFEVYQLVKQQKLLRTVTLGMNNYIVESTLPKITWKVSSETKKIGDYTCQKAIGNYGGRTYIAWFAPSLPFQNGPWKLSGLPGLILEATDSKNEVSFLFKELSKPDINEGVTTASNSKRLIKVNGKDFERLKKVYEEDPVRGFQSQIPTDGPKVSLTYIDDKGNVSSGEEAKAMMLKDKKEIKNNPIEIIK